MFTFFLNALNERITNEAHNTGTDSVVIHNLTASIKATCVWTRIHTFLVNTCFILRIFSAHNTFWSACRWWTIITCLTWAGSVFIYYTTHTDSPHGEVKQGFFQDSSCATTAKEIGRVSILNMQRHKIEVSNKIYSTSILQQEKDN
jgi:hypothetical protein